MVEGLLAKKSGIMPWPAAIITAVGTKVFLFDAATRKWSPDPAYSALLDDGWNLQEVSRCSHVVAAYYCETAYCTLNIILLLSQALGSACMGALLKEQHQQAFLC